jgi:hypothetical protein
MSCYDSVMYVILTMLCDIKVLLVRYTKIVKRVRARDIQVDGKTPLSSHPQKSG